MYFVQKNSRNYMKTIFLSFRDFSGGFEKCFGTAAQEIDHNSKSIYSTRKIIISPNKG